MIEPATTRRSAWMRYALPALVVASLIAFGPILATLSAGLVANLNGCALDEGSVHPCVVLGMDLGGFLYGLAVTGWLFLLTFPLAIVVVAGWVVFAIVALLRMVRRNAAQ
jgi:hypothetical protein